MREIILSKRLGDGRMVEVEVQEYAIGRYRLLAYVAGKWVDGPEEPLPLPMPRAGFTHYLGGNRGGPLVALTEAEVATLSRHLDERRLMSITR